MPTVSVLYCIMKRCRELSHASVNDVPGHDGGEQDDEGADDALDQFDQRPVDPSQLGDVGSGPDARPSPRQAHDRVVASPVRHHFYASVAFHIALRFVLRCFGNVLSTDELREVEKVVALPGTARELLLRLACRKGPSA